MHDLTPYLEDGVGVEDGVDLRENPFQQGRDDVPHHGGTGKEELEFENPKEQREHYLGPITRSRSKLVNLVTYLDCKEVWEASGAVGVISGAICES